MEKTLTPKRHLDSQTILKLSLMRKKKFEKGERFKSGKDLLMAALDVTFLLFFFFFDVTFLSGPGRKRNWEYIRDVSENVLFSIYLATNNIAIVQRNDTNQINFQPLASVFVHIQY